MFSFRKYHIAVQLSEAIRALCDEPGVTILTVTGDHVVISGCIFDSAKLPESLLEATHMNEAYQERLKTIRSLAESLREVFV